MANKHYWKLVCCLSGMYVSKKDKMIWLTLNQEDVVCLLPPEMGWWLDFWGKRDTYFRPETFKLYNRPHYSSAGRLMYPSAMVLSAQEESAEKILNSRWESSSQPSTFYIGCSKFTSHALWLSQRWKIKGRGKRDFSNIYYNQWSVWWVNPKMISDDRLWNLSWFPTLVTYAKNCWKEFQ